MKGYHYTSYENWCKIKKFGLVPNEVSNVTLPDGTHPKGIWIWKEKKEKKAHLGNIVRTMAIFDTTRVILLEVEYKDIDILRYGKQELIINHYGTIEKFVYQSYGDDISRLLRNIIYPKRINLIGDYDLLNIENIVQSANGRPTDSESVYLGSNPGSTTKELMVPSWS